MLQSSRRRLLAGVAGASAIALTASGFGLGANGAPGLAAAQPTGSECRDATASGSPALHRQHAFGAAARTYHVPESVLLGVSYLGSQWDDHGLEPSTSGGYGPMHLTDLRVPARDGKGDGAAPATDGAQALHLIDVASRLTDLGDSALRADDLSNICGGAAVLASYQRQLNQPLGERTAVSQWYDAVRRYNSTVDTDESALFARQVFQVIKQGASRTTNDGQRVHLAAHPGLAVPVASTPTPAAEQSHVDCPTTLDCEWIPAPYEWYGAPDPGAYGNHDLADRPDDFDIDYIVIHDTETSYDETIRLVTDPTYVSWNYTIRSSDGHVAQHLDPKDVGFHAGNWYVNMHRMSLSVDMS